MAWSGVPLIFRELPTGVQGVQGRYVPCWWARSMVESTETICPASSSSAISLAWIRSHVPTEANGGDASIPSARNRIPQAGPARQYRTGTGK